ncbi:hypothetical protein EfsSVR2331_16850 [Enterococcus faecalis]|nr:hypothetical protein EfsSVR2331_16850 [Enterococcus faecalis]
MKNKRLTFVVSLLAIYLIGAFFCESKSDEFKEKNSYCRGFAVCQSPRIG